MEQPQAVNVSMKVVEFQTTRGVETGLSAYFLQNEQVRPYGRVSSGSGAITSADLTFPTSTAAGITVFLDRISLDDGEIELVLQGLVDENRAFILSRPKAMVKVGSQIPAQIKTVQRIPYENTQVVGSTTVQVTQFEDTGVQLLVYVPEVVDDDGNWATTDDTYVRLFIKAEVKEEGQRVTISLDDELASGGVFSLGNSAILVPEFVSRSITTQVWVRHGQVLILGGLYRNTKSRTLATLPWLAQGEDALMGALDRLIPGNLVANPISSTLGNRQVDEGRRELVFLLKAEAWRPAFSVADDYGFGEEIKGRERMRPSDVITDVLEGISSIPSQIGDTLSTQDGADEGISSVLGDRP